MVQVGVSNNFLVTTVGCSQVHNMEERWNTLLVGGMHYEQLEVRQALVRANQTSSSHPL